MSLDTTKLLLASIEAHLGALNFRLAHEPALASTLPNLIEKFSPYFEYRNGVFGIADAGYKDPKAADALMNPQKGSDNFWDTVFLERFVKEAGAITKTDLTYKLGLGPVGPKKGSDYAKYRKAAVYLFITHLRRYTKIAHDTGLRAVIVELDHYLDAVLFKYVLPDGPYVKDADDLFKNLARDYEAANPEVTVNPDGWALPAYAFKILEAAWSDARDAVEFFRRNVGGGILHFKELCRHDYKYTSPLSRHSSWPKNDVLKDKPVDAISKGRKDNANIPSNLEVPDIKLPKSASTEWIGLLCLVVSFIAGIIFKHAVSTF